MELHDDDRRQVGAVNYTTIYFHDNFVILSLGLFFLLLTYRLREFSIWTWKSEAKPYDMQHIHVKCSVNNIFLHMN